MNHSRNETVARPNGAARFDIQSLQAQGLVPHNQQRPVFTHSHGKIFNQPLIHNLARRSFYRLVIGKRSSDHSFEFQPPGFSQEYAPLSDAGRQRRA